MRVSLNVSISCEIAFMIKILFVVREYRRKTNFPKIPLWPQKSKVTFRPILKNLKKIRIENNFSP
jgi:hypothetical protein